MTLVEHEHNLKLFSILLYYILILNTVVKTEDMAKMSRGKQKWVPDNESTKCQICNEYEFITKFFLAQFNRRHHCRACGKASFLRLINIHYK